jgi:hypothetical protein
MPLKINNKIMWFKSKNNKKNETNIFEKEIKTFSQEYFDDVKTLYLKKKEDLEKWIKQNPFIIHPGDKFYCWILISSMIRYLSTDDFENRYTCMNINTGEEKIFNEKQVKVLVDSYLANKDA